MNTHVTSSPNLHPENPSRDASGVTFLSCMSPAQHYDNTYSYDHPTHTLSGPFAQDQASVGVTQIGHETSLTGQPRFTHRNPTASPSRTYSDAPRDVGHTPGHEGTPNTNPVDNGARRWGFLPVRRFNVYRFMSNMKRLHIVEVILGCFMLFINSAVLFISLKREVGCFYSLTTWLIVLTIIALVRLPPQIYVVHKLRVLQREWAQQSVTHDLVSLCKGFLFAFNRSLAIINFIWYFIGFRWAYYTGTCGSTSPFIFQYITVLILIFLALVGLNSVVCLFSISYMLYILCLSRDTMEAIFQDIDRGAMPVPKRVLKRLTSLEWQGDESRDAIIALKNESSHANGPMDQDDETDFVCAICLCEYEVGQRVRILPCLHNFHKICIDEWFRAHSTCPLRCHINLLSPDCTVNMQHCDSLRRAGVIPSPIASPTVSSRAVARLGRLCLSGNHQASTPAEASDGAIDSNMVPRNTTWMPHDPVLHHPHTNPANEEQAESLCCEERFSTPYLRSSNSPRMHPPASEAQLFPSHSFQSCTACSVLVVDGDVANV